MRIILFTGKGGVGKTSVAAATALRSAAMGHRTIVLSTDPAHSLSDSFDRPLSPDTIEIEPNLWTQEIEILHQLDLYWGVVQEWLSTIFSWRGMDKAVAEEMTIFPGMEELASLLQIIDHYDSKKFDTIIVDCAPTAETLRLLTFPDVARWWLEKIFPIQRRAAQLLRPIMRTVSDVPLPDDAVFQAVQKAIVQLERMRDLLSDPEISSMRLVLNAEKMVIKEAQRTFTYFNLFSYPADAVISNRLLPKEVSGGYFGGWRDTQTKYMDLVRESFSPLPILEVPFFEKEVVGTEMLTRMADSVYGQEDPTKIFFHGKTHEFVPRDGGYLLTLPLPFTHKPDINVLRVGDELVIQVGSYKRNIILPRALLKLDVKEARFEGQELHVNFS